MIKRYNLAKERREARTRAKVKGSLKRPRLSVFRSNRYIYAQIINDQKGETQVAASEMELQDKDGTEKKGLAPSKLAKTERARLVGKIVAHKALKEGIRKVVFDRGPYKYHGRVKTLAKGAREGGLEF